jgi:putative MATE family efflux protein
MYEGTNSELFMRYAVPQLIGLLFNSVYIIVDGVFIGRRLGTDAMAAAAVSVPLVEILTALSIAIASGAGAQISRHVARGQKKYARQIFNTAIAVSSAAGALVTITGWIFMDPLAVLLGSTPEIHSKAIEYMKYIVLFSPFILLNFLLGGLARNDGCPKLAMSALTLGSLSNILLDYVFMYPLNMGVGGAALATALGPIFSIMLLLPHFLLKKGFLYFAPFRLRLQNVLETLVSGFPSFIMEFTIGMVTFIYNFAIIKYGYGELGLAAYLLIGYLMLIILTLFLGMAEGLQPVFSYFAGLDDLKRCREMRRCALKYFFAAGIACTLLAAIFSDRFYALFNPGDLELIEFAHEKSLYYFSGFSLAGCNILMISYWQSTGSTGRALIVSLSRSVVWLPVLTAVLPALFGRNTIWGCHSLTETITALTALILVKRSSRGNNPGSFDG